LTLISSPPRPRGRRTGSPSSSPPPPARDAGFEGEGVLHLNPKVWAPRCSRRPARR
jgi:hypothetical protein